MQYSEFVQNMSSYIELAQLDQTSLAGRFDVTSGVHAVALKEAIDGWALLAQTIQDQERPFMLAEQVFMSQAADLKAYIQRLETAELTGDVPGLEEVPGLFEKLHQTAVMVDDSYRANEVNPHPDLSPVLTYAERQREAWIRDLAVAETITGREDTIRELAAQVRSDREQTLETLKRTQVLAGTRALESYQQAFKKHADDEEKRANGFRAATISVLIGIILIGASLATSILIWPPESPNVNVSEIVYRIAVLTALGALAGYLGRQAGHHRRGATWARSLELQLTTFQAFVEPLEDETLKSSLYDYFGRRVLGPPPESVAKSDDNSTALATQIVDLASKLSQRSS